MPVRGARLPGRNRCAGEPEAADPKRAGMESHDPGAQAPRGGAFIDLPRRS